MRRLRFMLLMLCALAVGAAQAVFAADQAIPKKSDGRLPGMPTLEKPGELSRNLWKQQSLPGSDKACLQWTDGCRTCQREGPDTFTCSNVAIACIQTSGRCTQSEKP